MKEKKIFNVAVVGVGAVGVEMLRCLKTRKFPVNKLLVLARSSRTITVDDDEYPVRQISPDLFEGMDIALFAGTEGEKGAAVTYAPEAVQRKCVVIDNGSDFRLQPEVPLIVPEANKAQVKTHKGIIANPNCTTIQAVVALARIHREFGLQRMIMSSYQATSGAGKKATQILWHEAQTLVNNNQGQDILQEKQLPGPFTVFPFQIAFNIIPQIGDVGEQGYTSEEWKVVNETHKILNDKTIKISATCVRVPVFTSHCESIYFETKNDTTLEAVIDVLKSSKGVKFMEGNTYALPLHVEGSDFVYVSRVRSDPSNKNSFWMWVVADNLRKGAALNAIQIAEALVEESN